MTKTALTRLRVRLRAAGDDLTRPAGPRPTPTPAGRAFDTGLALLLGVMSAQFAMGDLYEESHRHGTGGLAALLVLVAVAAGALAWRRSHPLTVLWIVMAANALTPHDATRLTFYALIIAAYSAAAHSPYRTATMLSLGPTVVLAVVVGRSVPYVPGMDVEPTVPVQWVPLLVSVPLVVTAVGLRTWRERAAESRTRLSAVERARTEELRVAVEHERARIARELHDVVTHNVSVMVIQAGAARKILDRSPDEAREALLAVESGGRAAMAELRHVMGLLTMDTEDDAHDGGDGGEAGRLAPQPGLGRLDSLVERVRAGGVDVTLAVHGPARPLPPGIELAAYRVVQEALTNTVKHATGARASVRVDYGADDLRVEVADSGGAPGPSATAGDGRGLIGLRERLAVYGGTLDAAPRLLGGYRVQALIPLDQA
ncbi:sensor histidine kinase [Streptomyces mangrovisoli]|uniref:histidine kinase n=1 Tax=Streptomyces mangrovisoli TaxID=1428628 RepID=A0A1J4NWX9_9ACTN|nr:histidine kinase [Streptomyces mangrovisoli]OIJ66851.1 sensor histidine kinase [Streptomyces mangrovisoli]